MIGRTLSHYNFLEELSRGDMGIVYKALDLKLNREVALKVLPPELVSDLERKRRFETSQNLSVRLSTINGQPKLAGDHSTPSPIEGRQWNTYSVS